MRQKISNEIETFHGDVIIDPKRTVTFALSGYGSIDGSIHAENNTAGKSGEEVARGLTV